MYTQVFVRRGPFDARRPFSARLWRARTCERLRRYATTSIRMITRSAPSFSSYSLSLHLLAIPALAQGKLTPQYKRERVRGAFSNFPDDGRFDFRFAQCYVIMYTQRCYKHTHIHIASWRLIKVKFRHGPRVIANWVCLSLKSPSRAVPV